ncbi:MAG: hypothetical protein NZL95_07475 [Chitinophagales bacterium]|nr:hypothetical protein [Chitinophagales bacterium]MDW8428375.1 hypothetical protein [Chitinophagales bacterium]
MFDFLLKNYMEIMSTALQQHFGLQPDQARQAANSFAEKLKEFFQSKLNNGQLNAAQLADLLNSNTPNQTNALFDEICNLLTTALKQAGLDISETPQLSREGLERLLRSLQQGPVGKIDEKTISSMLSMMTGKKPGLGSLFSGLGALFKK